jgi:hypothetical protein
MLYLGTKFLIVRGGLDHLPAGPVRRRARWSGQRHLDHPLDGRRRQPLLAPRPRRVVQQPIDPRGHEPRLPAPDRRLALAGLALDRHGAEPIATQQHYPSPPHMLLRAIPRSDHGCQPFAVARTKPDLIPFLIPIGWEHDRHDDG